MILSSCFATNNWQRLLRYSGSFAFSGSSKRLLSAWLPMDRKSRKGIVFPKIFTAELTCKFGFLISNATDVVVERPHFIRAI